MISIHETIGVHFIVPFGGYAGCHSVTKAKRQIQTDGGVGGGVITPYAHPTNTESTVKK